MKIPLIARIALIAGFVFALCAWTLGQFHATAARSSRALLMYQASAIPQADLMQPEELVRILKSSTAEKPLLLQVGSRVLYEEAHIPGSEYVGPASTPAGLEKLRQRLQSVARKQSIILYCGCCPWSHCPNIKPAWDLALSMGFSKLKVLYIANNFGADWADKGYPTAKGL